MAGHRQAIAPTDAHTHSALFDPTIEIRDPYRGNGQALGTTIDAMRFYGEGISAGYSPWRFVVMSFISDVPGVGRRKVVIFDQRNAYSASVLLKDTFTDTAAVLLENHTMDVGVGWTVSGNNVLKINPSGTLDLVGSTIAGWAISDSGQTNATLFSVDLTAVNTKGCGLVVRAQDTGNLYSIRLSTTLLEVYKRLAGVDSLIATENVTFTAGTKHTLTATLSGTALAAFVDGFNELDATLSSFTTATKHGVYINTDAGGHYSPLQNFSDMA